MQQDLKCADARHLIHLSVGDDLLEIEERQLAEHMPGCSSCREYHSDMVSASHILEQVRADVPDTQQNSIWPELSERLKKRVAPAAQVTEGRRFNVSVATLCACSIVLALVTAFQNLPSNESEEFGFAATPVNMGTSVAFQPGLPLQQMTTAPQVDPSRLVPIRQPNGQIILIDPVSGQSFVPANIPITFQSIDNDRY